MSVSAIIPRFLIFLDLSIIPQFSYNIPQVEAADKRVEEFETLLKNTNEEFSRSSRSMADNLNARLAQETGRYVCTAL